MLWQTESDSPGLTVLPNRDECVMNVLAVAMDKLGKNQALFRAEMEEGRQACVRWQSLCVR